MKTDVVYFSTTGHSRKLAEAVAKALSVEAKDLSRQSGQVKADLLFIVTGIYGGSPNPKVMEFIETLSPQDVKRAVLITSSMGKKRQDKVRHALEQKMIPVLADEFTCKGSFLIFGLGHPNQDEIRQACDFAVKAAQEQPLLS